jgi:hypothetical protein
MEEYTLTTPETIPAVTNTAYKVVFLQFEWTRGQIAIYLEGQNGERVITGYGGPPPATQAERDAAIQMMRTLNTANLTTKSLQKRVLEKLSADGKIPGGTVTGAPDPPTAEEPGA